VRDSLLVGVAFALLYAAGAARTVQGGDAGEFMTVAAAGGVAHPPGYPLYVSLAAQLVTVLPGANVAWKVSVGSALLGGATVGVLHRSVALATGNRLAALVGAAAMGVSPLFWKWSGVAEVLSGAVLTAALLLWAAVRSHVGARGPAQAAVLGLAFATGIANHHTAILLLPLIAYAGLVALPRPFDVRSAAATFGTFVGVALLAGLLPYLLLMSDGGAWRWGETSTGDGLVHHFLRADYGTLTASAREEGSGWWSQPWLYVGGAARRFPGLLWLLAPVGLWRLARRSRGFALSAAGAWLLAGPLFLMKFDLPTFGYTRVVIERFHPVPDVVLAFCVGVGAAWVLGHPRWSRPAIPAVLLGVNVAVAGAMAAPAAQWTDWTVLDDYLHNAFAAVEDDALILTHGDSMFFGGLYKQAVEGAAPGVAWVNPGLLMYPWYRASVTATHPDLVLERDGRGLSADAVVAANRGRPTYVAPRLLLQRQDVQRAMAAHSLTFPVGSVLMKVVPTADGAPIPTVLEAAMEAALRSARFGSSFREEDLDHELEGPVWENYAIPWLALATGYEAGGDAAGAARARAVAEGLAPWLVRPQ